jgi:hypothetical protein
MDELAERFISPGKALSQQSSAEARLERALLRSTKTMLQTIKRAALARSLQPAFATNLWHQAIVDTLTAVGIERGSQEWRFLADGLSQLDLGDEAYTSAMVVLNTARQINGTFMTQIAAGGKPGDFYGELRQLGTTWRTRVNRTVRTGYTGFSGFVAQQAFRLARRQEKRWVAHHDDHTRHTHLEADGQTVAIEANFVIGGEQLQYPGDRRGTLSEIGNCRCVMVSPR